MQHKTALVVGATGIVGRELVKQLCNNISYKKIVVWVRHSITFNHPKLDIKIIDFERIAEIPIEAIDEIYCALGTTMKQAGSKSQFLKVDVEYPTAIGEWGQKAGVSSFLLVSAPNASVNSTLFYLRAKGLAEKELIEMPWQTLMIFHPPLISGKRSDRRFIEQLSINFLKILPKNWFKTIQPMSGKAIAEAMIFTAQAPPFGVTFYRPQDIKIPKTLSIQAY